MKEITESGITFSLDENSLFHIEPYISNIYKNEGIKTTEFNYIHGKTLFLVEAKKTIPRPSIIPDVIVNLNWDTYISALYEKFYQTLNVQIMGIMKRKDITEIPKRFYELDWKNTEICFLLIIPTAPNDKLVELSQLLEQALRRKDYLNLFTLWNNSVKVINEEHAKRMGLIAPKNEN